MKNLLAIVMLLVSTSVFGQVGLWHDPDNTGHGIQINKDSGFGHAVTWYLYRKDGSTAFLTAGETCKEFPCVVSLHEPVAGFMGQGEFSLGEPVGLVELSLTEEGELIADYELINWITQCQGASPGGIIFYGCIGKLELSLLTE